CRGGYLGEGPAGGGSALPPTLEGFPPVPHFFAAFGCHGAPSSPRLALVSEMSNVPTSSLREVYPGLHRRPRTHQSPSSCRDDTRGHAAKAQPPLLADTRRRIVYCRGIPYGERPHTSRGSALWQPRN